MSDTLGRFTLPEAGSGTGEESPLRRAARQQVERRRKVRADAVAYVVINAFLVGVWAVLDRGYFWPGWVLAIWGVLLLLAFWDVYLRRPVSDAEVDAEVERRRR